MAGRHRDGFVTQLLDEFVSPTFFLVFGVLLIQLAFVYSYVGAFHHPEPHRVPIVVAAPAQVSARAVQTLNSIPGSPVKATPVATPAAALRDVRQGSTDGALSVDSSSATDTLYVAGGGGAAVVEALEEVIGHAETAQRRQVRFVDAVPAQPGDARGLSGFYLVIGWLIGGYLVAALISIARGASPAGIRGAMIRLTAFALYAIVSGLGGALIIGPWLGALTGHLLAIWGIGTLLVFAAATVTMAFQTVAGVLGIGLTLVLFVIIGNPSAGGAYPAPLLPGLWRTVSSYIPNGAGVQAVRKVVYFGGHGITDNLIVIAIYVAAGLIVTLAVTARKGRAAPRSPRMMMTSNL
ncbi:MAG TPA: hypothetical protein VHV75_07220 [Solirubrobacteraceae bacterium]|jgi:hypothetical protein|nr:hypothetical protein [Solirubrobacteraceae bacterium]